MKQTLSPRACTADPQTAQVLPILDLGRATGASAVTTQAGAQRAFALWGLFYPVVL